MSFSKAICVCFSKYAVFSGRARRSEYWFFILFSAIINIVASLNTVARLIPGSIHVFWFNGSPVPINIIQVIVGIITFFPVGAVAVRRLHDTGRSGWHIFLCYIGIPLVLGFYFASSISSQLKYEYTPFGYVPDWESIKGPLELFAFGSVIYLIYSLCIFIWLCQDSNVGTNEYGDNPKFVVNNIAENTTFYPNFTIASVTSVPVIQQPASQTYEPVLGVETEALIKRAMLFLEDEEFDNAERYLEQALNQDAENPRVHFAKLMLERKVHNVEQLIEKSTTPLDDEKLFQRALRFADGEYKTQLEDYAQKVRDKLAQAKAERENEQKRIQSEREAEQKRIQAEKEKRYQEILKFKETASEIADFQELLSKINLLRPYKDTNNLYDEVYQALYQARKVEMDYQDAIRMIEAAKNSADFNSPLNILQTLGDYKEAGDWIETAKKSQEEAIEKEKKRLKLIIGSIIAIALTVAAFYGIRWYQERAERIAQEKAIEEARIAREQAEERERQARIAQEAAQKKLRQDAMTAFFEEKPDAEKLIRNTPDFMITSVFLGMLEYLNYENGKLSYIELASSIEQKFSWLRGNDSETEREAMAIAQGHDTKAANRFLGDFYSSRAWNDKYVALLEFNSHAESGDKYSQFRMAQIYNAMGDKDNAAKWYKILADNGTPNEKTKIGNIFYKGEDIPQDYKQAYELYSQAAESGDAEAQNNIGYFYQRGFYVDKDYQKAFEWYLKAAEQGMAISQEAVGYSYANGRGVKQDLSQAVNWYTKAANQGREYSQYRLGELYMEGKGVAQNYNTALQWFRKAADKNNAPAMDKIGWFYQNGWGVNQDYTQAMQWYRKAAEQNNLNAQASIGFLYYEGLGVTKDLNTALEWYKKSAAQGNDIAQKQVNLIELRLQGEQTRRKVNTSDFPLPAIVAGNRVGVREGAYASAKIKNVLNTGHPVSVSRRVYSSDGEYYYVRTASGTEGWVKGDYLVFKEANLTYHERENRRVSLPASGRVATSHGDALNVRNIPSVKGSKVVDKIDNGFYIERVLEIFATEDVDWYHVRYIKDYEELNWKEGWVSGKYININENSANNSSSSSTSNRNTSSSTTSPQSSSSQQDDRIKFNGTAKDFADEVYENPLRAEAKYKGEIVVVIGEVLGIGTTVFGDTPQINIDIPNRFGWITCNMQKNDSMMYRISKGHTIAVAGLLDKADPIWLKNCRIASVYVNNEWIEPDD